MPQQIANGRQPEEGAADEAAVLDRQLVHHGTDRGTLDEGRDA